MRRGNLLSVLGLFALAGGGAAGAAVRLPQLFSNHMVLQRHAVIPVWGWAKAGQKVTVHFAGKRFHATANAHGKWLVRMAPLRADAHGRTLAIHVNRGGRIAIRDVLVGDVWLCSGQSNMQFPVDGSWARALHARREVAAAHFPLIRLLKVPMSNTPRPQRKVKARWTVCAPATVKDFSAVAYFFGRDLFSRIHVPVGVIDSSYGGTVIQSWTPMSALKRTPALHRDVLWFSKAARRYHQQLRQYQRVMRNWAAAARKARAAGRAKPPKPRVKPPQDPFTLSRPSPDMAPASIFNAMIHPLIPYALRGVVWYQGENNAWVNDRLYGVRLQAMIKGWRRDWANGAGGRAPAGRGVPFLIVQIAPYFHYPAPTVGVPLVWQGEEQAVRKLPRVGMISTTDATHGRNIHYRNKQAVGRRLTQLALHMAYGRGRLRSIGPMYKSMSVKHGRIVISFSGVRGALVSSNHQPLDWFQIAGPNRKFLPAQAKIKGHTVVVQAAAAPHPVAVRFAWNCNAHPNLMDRSGRSPAPVLPFRTDHWPVK